MANFRLIFTAVSTIIFASFAHAQRSKTSPQITKIGIIQENYSGTKYHSLSEGSPAYGFEISTDRGNTFIRYFLKGRVTYSTGRQSFLSSGTVFNSAYQLTSFAPELGIAIYPVLRRDRGMNLYLWGTGVVSYNFLEINTSPTNSLIRPKDQGAGYGYGGGLGFEFMVGGARSRGKSMIYGEVGFRDEKTELVNEKSYELGGITFSLGFGF